MVDIAKEVGNNIKFYRKQLKMTTEQLASKICKSKSTLSKYENGQISIDIATLYEIAEALHVRAEQFLYSDSIEMSSGLSRGIPAFFQGMSQFYLYYFDGRKNRICCSVADVGAEIMPSVYQLKMYMNVKDHRYYRLCGSTYAGHIYHYDSMSCIILQNVDMSMEQYQVSIPHPYLNAPTKWGLGYGISSSPLMPTSTKILISKTIQEETPDFEKELRLSKEDIRLMKLYNMLTIQ